ncbi:aldolase/citrate lyase family protein [Sulfitobacter sabulilitoris]|uniref:Hydroxypyruvate/pyruvate aldolase n=1 Tax=Sulfitobacter sabulilitoris TaxID=2562655 RepID=A0A5S3PEE1_9RHOB|nr:HpcH/HpaI aldolase/citrate lyase family protein [Sulfitobacter sabulilitoris]TMM52420.1 2-keto-3-deoxy-L-rhamnonate aldolase [Sulfitobacter sabulilitoris]
MPAPLNPFKKALSEGETLFGCWLGLANGYTAEIMGTAGFDWLLIDGEHSPNDLPTIRDQLQVVSASDSHPIVRVPIGETWIIKQVLDAGAQTVLVPMVESADQARELVRACRFPPVGDRGVGYAMARASNFGQTTNYGPTADAQICLLVQVENRAGLAALDEILQVEGVDGVFIGPADLAASLGHLGDMMHDTVQSTIMDALQRISASGKAAGILSTDDAMTRASLDAGARFVAVGLDVVMLAQAARTTASKWRDGLK